MQGKDQPEWLKISGQDKTPEKKQLRLSRNAVAVRALTFVLPWFIMGLALVTTQAFTVKPALESSLQNLAAAPAQSTAQPSSKENSSTAVTSPAQTTTNGEQATASSPVNATASLKQINPQPLSNPGIAWPTSSGDDDGDDDAEEDGEEEFEDEIDED